MKNHSAKKRTDLATSFQQQGWVAQARSDSLRSAPEWQNSPCSRQGVRAHANPEIGGKSRCETSPAAKRRTTPFPVSFFGRRTTTTCLLLADKSVFLINALPETANFLLASIIGLKIMHMLSVPRGRKTWGDTAPPKKFIFF